MNPFIYAPPPPPPPTAQAPPPPPAQSRGGYAGTGNNRRGGGNPRGRGGGNRGGNRGGAPHGHNNTLRHGVSANATPIGQPQPQPPSHSQGLPTYPQWQQPTITPPQAYHQPQAGAAAYPPSFYPQTAAHNTYTPPIKSPNTNPYYGYGGAQPSTLYPLPLVQSPPINHQARGGLNQTPFKSNDTNLFKGSPAQRYGLNNRKRNFRAHNSNHAAETKPEKKPKVATAPAVPAFGADVVGANLALPARPDWLQVDARGKSHNKKKGKKNNALGLTPSSDVHHDSEEDIDEEAAFVKRVGNLEVLEFEHRGKKISLAGEAERKAYLAERRANYPTQARIAEKQAKAKAAKDASNEKSKQMKLEASAERQHDKTDKDTKVKVIKPLKPKREAAAVKAEQAGDASQPSSSSKDPKVLVAYLEEQLKSAPDMLVAYLGEQLKQAKEAVAAADAATEFVKKGEDVSSSDGSSAMSESDSDSDAPPEETSIKPAAPIHVPPRREAPNPRTKSICKNFQRGHCKFGRRCKHLHEKNPSNQPRTSKAAPKAATKTHRKSLHEVMVEKERKQEALAAVNVIKYLGSLDFFT